jgi:RNA polymerase sigma-70 factor (ECF subfamily)
MGERDLTQTNERSNGDGRPVAHRAQGTDHRAGGGGRGRGRADRPRQDRPARLRPALPTLRDATSLVFAKALGSLSTCRGDAVRAWLFGIAHHVIADRFRARDPEAPLEAASRVPDSSPSPQELAEAGDARRRLWAALAQLPPEQRRVVELRLAGLTSAEIGQALGRSRGAVDVAQCRAVARLRGLLVTAEEGRHGPR